MMAAPLPVVVASRVVGLAAALGAHPAAASVALTYVPLDTGETTAAAAAAAAAPVLAGAAVVLADPPAIAPLLGACASLRWLHSTYAGVNALMVPGLRQDYTLTRLRGQLGPLMAEYVLGQVLVHERQWLRLASQQRERRWEPGRDTPYRPLSTLTLLVLGGLGDLGQAVARAAKAFGMRVHALARSRIRPAPSVEPPPVADALFFTDDGGDVALSAALADADYVVNVLPSTPATRGLLTAARLAACRRRPVFINVGRGDVVAEDQVLAALDAGHLRHAVLDVFEREPLPEASPLWTHPAVTITPHVSALSLPAMVAASFYDAVACYQAGQPLPAQVAWARGY